MKKSISRLTLKRLFFTLTFLVSLLNNSLGQCDVSVDKSGISTYVTASNEIIYQNEDLENGVDRVYLRTAIRMESDGSGIYYHLDLSTGTSDSYRRNEIVPREVLIKNASGTIKLTDSDVFYDKSTGNVKFTSFRFTLTNDEFTRLKSNSVQSIIINDTRKNKYKKITPYGSLIKDQINCIFRKLGY